MPDSNGCPRGHTFPCASLDEALPELRRPPAPAAVRFKLTATSGDSGQVAAYVDARLVFDRLDLVCGGAWHARFDALPAPLRPKTGEGEEELLHARCRLTVFGVTREDVGEGDTPKAAFSDAIKRAAVHFGVGRALYAMASPWLDRGPGAGQLRTTRKGRLKIDERSEAHLRRGYERWLAEKGIALFGRPLEHGDEAGAPGFEVVEGARQGGGEKHGVRDAERSDGDAEAEQAGSGEGEGSERRPAAAARQPDTHPSQPDVSGHVESGGLRAVTDGAPSEPPASPQDRKPLLHWQQAGRYRDDTVAQLARLATGQGMVDRLTRTQVRRVVWLLELAVGGRVAQRTLQGSLTRLAKQERPPAEADAMLEGWLRKKYDEVALLGRREAA